MYVYFFHSNYGLFPIVKIGFSKNPETRLKQIQPNFPEQISFNKDLNCVYCEGEFEARKLENTLHKRLKKHRMFGEWFLCQTEVYNVIAKASQ